MMNIVREDGSVGVWNGAALFQGGQSLRIHVNKIHAANLLEERVVFGYDR